MVGPSAEELEFVDRMGLWFEKFGGPRTMGRIYAWLVICDPPHQSLTEMAQALGASKASISTVVRQLQEAGMVERFPVANRRHHYRVAPGGFTHVLRVQTAHAAGAVETVELGLTAVAPGRREQRERLEDMRDFFGFMADETENLIRQWEEHRRKGADS